MPDSPASRRQHNPDIIYETEHLVVRGADSDILSSEAAQQMLAAQPHAREVEIPRAAHMVFEDNPDAFLAAVRAFL